MISQFLSVQASRENKKLADKLYNEMNTNFLEHTMYDVNDALTSILAICDMEEMENIPKVKQYIQRINNLLNDVQIYQGRAVFNINHVLKNVIDVVSNRFKNKVKIQYTFSEIKPFVKTNKSQLEKILLYIFIELITAKQGADPLDISVHLNQKEQDAQIIIGNVSCNFSKTAIDEISRLHEGFIGNIQTSPKEQGVEINIKLPLSFKKSTKADSPSITVSDIKVASHKPVTKSERAGVQ
jgi:hypothetical protein